MGEGPLESNSLRSKSGPHLYYVNTDKLVNVNFSEPVSSTIKYEGKKTFK